jgi:hypothetical protein
LSAEIGITMTVKERAGDIKFVKLSRALLALRIPEYICALCSTIEYSKMANITTGSPILQKIPVWNAN